jgi:hypothetical protein
VRRWVLATAAFLGWQSAGALPPRLPPGQSFFFKTTAANERITIRGVVLDDSLNVPVRGAYIFIKSTKYGAVTNEKGEFTFSFSSDWPLAKKGEFLLEVSAAHFIFKSQLAVASFKNHSDPPPLTVRLPRYPQYTVGKAHLTKPPAPPPGSGKSRP